MYERLGQDDLDTGIASSQNKPGSLQSAASRAPPLFDDSDSGPLVSKYLTWVQEYDKGMTQSLKDEAGNVFLFTGLFSAVVASLLAVSVQNVQQNPQDVSNIYLKNIQQLLTDANQTISLSSPPLKHKPPTNAVWVNSLWFLSLAINLACSVLANLLQQWARRYIRATQPRYNPKKRARTRAYYASGVEKFRLPLVFEALPAMLHLSVFLFATGLVVFLWNIDPILSKVVLVWLGICLILYFFFTLCPLRYHNSPYDTPFSMPVWYLWTRIHFLIVWNLRQFTCFSASSRLQSLERKYRQFSRQSFFTTTNQTALNSPIEINVAFLNDLDDDGMEHFFTDLPMFHDDLTQKEKPKQLKAFTAFLDSTFSSNFLSEHSKERRAIIYGKTLDPADLPDAYRSILDGVVSSGDYHNKGLISAEFGRFIRGWSGGGGLGEDAEGPFIVQAIYSGIIARAPRNDSWFAFASEEMGVSEAVLRDYAAHGHNLSLAILIHLVRQQFNHIGNSLWPAAEFSKLLEAASKFKVRKTSPALQHEFCALWNLVVLKARPDNNWTIGSNILGHIRGIYASLHPDAMDSQSPLFAYNEASYPTCTVPDHIPSAAAPASTLLRDKGKVPPRDNKVPVPGSSHPARKVQTLRPTDAPTRGTGGTDTSIVTIPLNPLASSASAPSPASMASISAPSTVVAQQVVGRHTSPDDLSNIFQISPPLSSNSAASLNAGGIVDHPHTLHSSHGHDIV